MIYLLSKIFRLKPAVSVRRIFHCYGRICQQFNRIREHGMNKNDRMIIGCGADKRLLCTLTLMLFLTVSSSYAHQASYSGLIVFGDSVSDPGNVYALTGMQSVAPYAPVPTFPYAIGGNHFSDGKTYVERLARSLHLNVTAKATFNPDIDRKSVV